MNITKENNIKPFPYFYIFIIFLIHASFLYVSGYFQIDLLSDDYMNFISAQTSGMSEKFSSTVPYYSNFHFRPMWFLSIDFSIFLNNILNISKGNFIFFRIENLLLFYLLTLISSFLLFRITKSKSITLDYSLFILLFTNNLNDICWTAGKVDLLCGIFIFASLFFTYKYYLKRINLFFILTLFFFIMALLTKETAVVLPFVTVVFFGFLNGKNALSEIRRPLVWEFVLLSLYIFYKIFVLKNYPHEVISNYQNPGLYSLSNVILNAAVALTIPFDYLSLQNDLFNGSIILYIYIIILALNVFFLIKLFAGNKLQIFLPAVVLLFLILILPNMAAGYFRPQLALIPFSIIYLFLFSVLSKAKNVSISIKTAVSLLLIFWCVKSFGLIRDWNYASEYSGSIIEIMCNSDKVNFKNNNSVVLGLPSRYKQASMLDYVTGPYNYQCNGKFKQINKINDLIHTGALDKNSLESEIKVNKITDNEFELKTAGETQYFLKLDLFKNDYRDSVTEISFSGYNNFNKPTKARVKFLSDGQDIYIYNFTEENKFRQLKEY